MKSVKIIIASTLAIIAALASQPVKAQSSTSGYSPEGVVLSKNVVAGSEPNSYTINLEAYVTGSSITTSSSGPLDVIMVLDFSNSLWTTSVNNWAPLKTAVNNFVAKIQDFAGKAENEGDVRLGIVSFGDKATELTNGLVNPLTDPKVLSLATTLNGYSMGNLEGGTKIQLGMEKARDWLASATDHPSSSKCVVVFTDGGPAPSMGSESTKAPQIAQAAINYAYEIKNTYNATIYTIGLLTDAQENTQIKNANYAQHTYYYSTTQQAGHEITSTYPVTVKTFLQRLSSNYKSAKIGKTNITNQSSYWFNTEDTKIQKDHLEQLGWVYPVEEEEYYSKTDASTLQAIFDNIANKVVGGASYELKETTTAVIDVVSPAFMLPEGVDENAISLRVAKYGQVIASGTDGSSEYGFFDPYDPKDAPTGETGFPNIVAKIGKLQKIDGGTQFSEAPDGKASSEFKAVSITGFDFSDNWVGVDVHDDQVTPHGYKLIISFPIVIDPNNPGGASSQTNTEDSGIYIDKDGDGKYDQIGSFEIPYVKIPNIVILKYGLKKGDSAIFKVFKVEEEGTESEFPIMLVATQGDGEYAIAKTKIQQPGRYKVVETAWSWAYTSTCESSYVNDDAGITDNDVWHSKGYGIGDETGYQAMKPYKLGTETTDNSITRNVNDFTEAEKEGEYKGTLFIFRNEAKNNIPAHGESFKNNVFFQTIR